MLTCINTCGIKVMRILAFDGFVKIQNNAFIIVPTS